MFSVFDLLAGAAAASHVQVCVAALHDHAVVVGAPRRPFHVRLYADHVDVLPLVGLKQPGAVIALEEDESEEEEK